MAVLQGADGWQYPLAKMICFRQVVSGPKNERKRETQVRFEGLDESVVIPTVAFDHAMAGWVQTTISAAPGTYLVKQYIIIDDDPVEDPFYRELVIAWVVSMSGAVLPVTTEGVQIDDVATLHPEGTVERPHVDSFDTYEKFVAAVKAAEEADQGKRGGASDEG